MAREYTRFQRGVIRRWYENRGAIEVQRLQELVTDIYLATSATKRARLWERARAILERIPDVDPAAIDALVAANDVETLADLASARFAAD